MIVVAAQEVYQAKKVSVLTLTLADPGVLSGRGFLSLMDLCDMISCWNIYIASSGKVKVP